MGEISIRKAQLIVDKIWHDGGPSLKEPRLRGAILTAINAIEPQTGRQMLQQALTDKDWALRLRAATLLRQQGVADVDAAVRPAPSDARRPPRATSCRQANLRDWRTVRGREAPPARSTQGAGSSWLNRPT